MTTEPKGGHNWPELSRRALLGATAGAAAALAAPGLARDASARAPAAPAGAPGFLRRTIGDLEVTALLDGAVKLPLDAVAKFLDGATPDALAPLNARARVPASGLDLLVAAFLVRKGDRLTLIDAGAADKFQPPHFGKLPAALKAAGYAPGDIDTVLVTHAHADHIAGLLDPAGGVVYPNAEIVLSETEHRFWTDDGNAARVGEVQKPFFELTRRTLAPYAGRVRLLSGTKEAVPGIVPVPLPGHTPGHTGYLVADGSEQLFVWGDALHIAAWQFDRPDWRMTFDVDPEAGITARRRALDMAATDGLLVAGMHLPFPGFAFVAREGSAYRHVTAL